MLQDNLLNNKTSKYFLSSFGSLSGSGIVHKKNEGLQGHEKLLMMDYTAKSISEVSIEVNADKLIMLYQG